MYATKENRYGTLFLIERKGGYRKIAGLPDHCIIDNDNHLTIDSVDRDWYIDLAKRYVKDFLGIQPPKKNTRKINSLAKKSLSLLDDE